MNNKKSTKEEFIKYKRDFIQDYLNEYNQILKYIQLNNQSLNKKVVNIFLIKVAYLYFLNIEGIEISGNKIIKREERYLDTVFKNIEYSSKNFFEDYLKKVLSSDFFCEINKLLNIEWNKIDINIHNDIFFNNNEKDENYGGKGLISILNRYNFSSKDNINYEQITPEILGDIYLHIFTEEYRSERGLIYTSKELVKCMCKHALIYYIEENSDMSIHEISVFINAENISEIDEVICNRITNRASIFVELLEKIKIIDPSSGCGAFIIGIMNEIIEIRLKISKIIGEDILLRELYLVKINIISNNIYAVDIDEFANVISLLRMWIYIIQDHYEISESKSLNMLNSNVIHGSTLELNRVILMEEFDIAIGNPPYIKYNKKIFEPIRESDFGNKYYQKGMNLYFYFFHKCMEIIKEKGFVVFITPNSYIYNSSAEKLRNHIYSEMSIKAWIKFDKLTKIFEGGKRGIKEEAIVSILQKNSNLYICELTNSSEMTYNFLQSAFNKQSVMQGKQSAVINSKIIYKNFIEADSCFKWILDESHDEILKKIYRNKVKLGEICEIHRGIDQDSNIIDGKVILSIEDKNNIKCGCTDIIKPFGKGEFINKYSIKTHKSLYINETEYKYCSKKYDMNKFEKKYKILNRKDYNKINKFALDEEQIIWPSSIIVTYIKEEYKYTLEKYHNIDEEVAIKFILGILNSKLILFWLFYNSKISERKLMLENRHVENIPILDLKSINKIKLNQVKKEVDSIISTINEKQCCIFDIDIQSNIDKIDSILYKEYEITDEEKKKIDYFLKKFIT